MSIRLIARDLYRLRQEIDELEKRIQTAPPGRVEPLKDELRKIRAEHMLMRRVLDGRIDRPTRRRR